MKEKREHQKFTKYMDKPTVRIWKYLKHEISLILRLWLVNFGSRLTDWLTDSLTEFGDGLTHQMTVDDSDFVHTKVLAIWTFQI